VARLLDAAQRRGDRLGRSLVTSGAARRWDVYRELAKRWDLPLIDLRIEDVDPSLCHDLDPHMLIGQGWFPIRQTDGGLVIAARDQPSSELAAQVRQAMGFAGAKIAWSLTTDWDVAHAVRTYCSSRLLEDAVTTLSRKYPVLSARRVVTRSQVVLIALLAVLAITVALIRPHLTVVAAVLAANVLFAGSIVFRAVAAGVGAVRPAGGAIARSDVAALTDDDLPSYTILVPAYREADVIQSLMRNLGALDYPIEKLEILLLLEDDDPETLAAAKAADPPDVVRFVIVPDGTPKTKPKACNVGLAFATGELLVIYDAEDRPEPDQLKKAVVAFRRGGPQLACLQAALNYFNVTQNALTRMFTLEYSTWFDLMLPALDRFHLTIPLGGTSNHFRTDALRRLGGWDPYNVTEDADLGVRCAALGYRVATIESTTYEEANCAVGNWIRQRSRWIKGYMQTALVHSRSPVTLVRHAGPHGAAVFGMLIAGTPMTFLLAPPLWVLSGLSLVDPRWYHHLVPPELAAASLITLIVCNVATSVTGAISAARRGMWRLAPWAVLQPIYWILHSIAAYKAAWQLITRPFYWEKTTHGLDTTPVATPTPLAA
jgi:cellulose synthase/poly-beta-1,6-N-acetylglucosamine synthase-like glycosyltransferase